MTSLPAPLFKNSCTADPQDGNACRPGRMCCFSSPDGSFFVGPASSHQRPPPLSPILRRNANSHIYLRRWPPQSRMRATHARNHLPLRHLRPLEGCGAMAWPCAVPSPRPGAVGGEIIPSGSFGLKPGGREEGRPEAGPPRRHGGHGERRRARRRGEERRRQPRIPRMTRMGNGPAAVRTDFALRSPLPCAIIQRNLRKDRSSP